MFGGKRGREDDWAWGTRGRGDLGRNGGYNNEQGGYGGERRAPRGLEGSFDSEFVVQLPGDSFAKELIDFTAEWVAREGPQFEVALAQSTSLSRDKDECQQFAFLQDKDSLEHSYYRWKVASLAFAGCAGRGYGSYGQRGGGKSKVRLVENSFLWVSPTFYGEADSALERGARGAKGAGASTSEDAAEDAAALDFLGLLVDLTPEKASIAKVVTHVFDRPKKMQHVVVKVLCKTFLSEPSPATLVAKLYLISDLLQNSFRASNSNPKIWKLLEERLPGIFEGLGRYMKTMSSRIEKEAMRQRISKVLQAWRMARVFPKAETLDQLQSLLSS